MNAKLILKIGCINGIISLSIASYGFYYLTPHASDREIKTTIINPKQAVIESVVKDKYIAEVIAKKKYPYTIAAIKKVESSQSGPLTVGDKGESIGMYQIQPRHHGEVPLTVEGQTDKVEDILEGLIKEQGYNEAIRAYNGSGSKARLYRKKVLTLVREMEYLEKELQRKS